jgi:hypothetical protein
MVWTNFQPGKRLSLFASCLTQFLGLWRTNILQWGQMHFCLLGFLGWVVPDPVNVGRLFPTVGVLALSCWVGCLPAPPVTSAFILSIMASMLALFVAVIAAIFCRAVPAALQTTLFVTHLCLLLLLSPVREALPL